MRQNCSYTFPPAARHHHSGFAGTSALSIWLSVDPLADKYPGLSPYTYCADNPVRLIDPDGREIYFLFYTDNESCFKASAETRKYNIEHSNHFNKNKDMVFLVAISDLADIESIVSYTVNQFSEQYGQTVELGIWSHAGYDGPCGTTTTSGNYSIYNQMTIEGWSQINFNWSDMDATATFYGCNTGAKNGEKESFAQKISELDNFHNVQVRGQQTASYPSTNPCWRDINSYHAKLGWFSSRNTYMVGGRNGKWFAAVFGGDYAIPLSCFKNGRRQLPTYQQSK